MTEVQAGPPVALGRVTTGAAVRIGGVMAGPPVIPGGGAAPSHFVYTQSTPATVWTIVHNLGLKPAAVSLFSLDFGIEYDEFTVQHLDNNILRISMDTPGAGVALIG